MTAMTNERAMNDKDRFTMTELAALRKAEAFPHIEAAEPPSWTMHSDITSQELGRRAAADNAAQSSTRNHPHIIGTRCHHGCDREKRNQRGCSSPLLVPNLRGGRTVLVNLAVASLSQKARVAIRVAA